MWLHQASIEVPMAEDHMCLCSAQPDRLMVPVVPCPQTSIASAPTTLSAGGGGTGQAREPQRLQRMQRGGTDCKTHCLLQMCYFLACDPHKVVFTPDVRCADQDPSAGTTPDDAVYSTLREIEDAGHKVRAQLGLHVQSIIATVVNCLAGP